MKEEFYLSLSDQNIIVEKQDLHCFPKFLRENTKKEKLFRFILDDHIDVVYASLKMDRPYFLYTNESNLFVISNIIQGKKVVDCPHREWLEKDTICYLNLNKEIRPFRSRYFSYESLSFVIDLDGLHSDLNNFDFKVEGLEMNCEEDYFAYEKNNLDISHLLSLISKQKINSLSDFIHFKHLLYESLVLMMELRQQKCHHNPRHCYKKDFVIEAERIIFRHLHEELSLEDLADSLYISISSLQSYFKEIKGITVYQFIRQAKIEHSKYYLEHTDMPIICIAQHTGYENPSKYSSTFKRLTGVTPSEYRRAFRKE